MKRACTVCGKPSASGRCNLHGGTHTGWSPNRDRKQQATFRKLLIHRAGGQCEATTDGIRCPETTDLRACHTRPVVRGGGYSLTDGLLLCKTHDKATDRYAR